MKKYLLPSGGDFYKANLHCHSTISDGDSSPEEIKRHYLKNGYSVVAFTDHNIFASHKQLNDENFLALNGVEININELGEWNELSKTCHMCFIAMAPDIDAHPLWDETMGTDKSESAYDMEYTSECVSRIMKTGKEKGFFVTYNHPRWSLENYEQYSRYENMNAMEIYNHECSELGFLEYDGAVYDEMLQSGKKIYALATDDLHRIGHSCGGYVMIKAERLCYESIAQALKNGEFYSSTGPRIYELWYDTDSRTVHIGVSGAKKIVFSTGSRHREMLSAEEQGCNYLTEADFSIKGNEKYIRITIIDEKGHTADTNAYFVEDL